MGNNVSANSDYYWSTDIDFQADASEHSLLQKHGKKLKSVTYNW